MYKIDKYYVQDQPKQLTPQQIKFADLIVYGVEGNPVTKGRSSQDGLDIPILPNGASV